MLNDVDKKNDVCMTEIFDGQLKYRIKIFPSQKKTAPPAKVFDGKKAAAADNDE